LFPKNARSGASLAAVALLCCAALAARAGEKNQIVPELTIEQDYDSNVFLQTDARGSALTIIRPALAFENVGTLGHVNLYGFLSEHLYWSESKLNGIDRGFGGDVSRRIFPRTTIFGNGSFQRIAAHSEIRGPDIVTTTDSNGIPGEPVVTPGQLIEGSVPDVDLGQGEFGVRQELTPRLLLSLSGGPYEINNLEDHAGLNTLRDRSGWFAGPTLDYQLTPLDHVSLQLQATGTDFSDAFSQTETPVNDPTDPHGVHLNTGKTLSEQQSLTIGWTRTWSELWTTNFAIGGRRLYTKTTDALRPLTRVGVNPQFGEIVAFVDYVPVEFNDTGPGVVGEISLQRVLPRGQIGLSYWRETRTTSSLFASNVNVDSVSLGFVHRLAPRVTFSLRGSYEHYESVNNNAQFGPATPARDPSGAVIFNPLTGPEYSCFNGSLITTGQGIDKTGQCRVNERSALHSDAWNAVARLDWQLYRRLSTFVVFRFSDRNGDEQLFGQNYDKYNAGVGFRYDYEIGF
jgi:hypothetical protein